MRRKNRERREARRRHKHAQDRLVCGALRGRSSYKWADNGEDGEKSAEKLTIENKFHVKQFFAARVSHETCLVGFFAAKTGQYRASAGNFEFPPKKFYRKIRCLSPKFFGAGCYTNFLRKIAVFHG